MNRQHIGKEQDSKHIKMGENERSETLSRTQPPATRRCVSSPKWRTTSSSLVKMRRSVPDSSIRSFTETGAAAMADDTAAKSAAGAAMNMQEQGRGGSDRRKGKRAGREEEEEGREERGLGGLRKRRRRRCGEDEATAMAATE